MDGPDYAPGMDLKIVSRLAWSGTTPVAYRASKDSEVVRPAPIVYIGNTFTHTCPSPLFCEGTLRQMQEKHFQYYPTDIKYNFMIGGDGRVYEGRGWYNPPRLSRDAPESEHFKSIFIAYISKYQDEEEVPQAMREAMENLIEYGKQFLFIDENVTIKNFMRFRSKSAYELRRQWDR